MATLERGEDLELALPWTLALTAIAVEECTPNGGAVLSLEASTARRRERILLNS